MPAVIFTGLCRPEGNGSARCRDESPGRHHAGAWQSRKGGAQASRAPEGV